jgi:hypothetical protein
LEYALSIAAGVGLSAATGFRIFVPFLVLSIAGMSGQIDLAPGFAWLATPPAAIMLAVATVLEIGAYYVPWLDNLLDSIATPAAAVAGTLAAASMFGDMSPLLQWTLAAIAGGGVATAVQSSTVLLRGASSLTTGGMGNFAVASTELVGSTGMSILAIVVPILALIVVIGMFVWIGGRVGGRRKARRAGLEIED